MEPFNDLSYKELDGWFEENHSEALEVFFKSSLRQHKELSKLDFNKGARYFFEENFIPTLVGSQKKPFLQVTLNPKSLAL